MTIKIPREQTEFVTEEGLLSWINVHPGTAKDSFRPGSKAYSVEIGIDKDKITQDSQIVKAVALVASTMDPGAWQRHVFGPAGRIKTLEERNRDVAKCPYYHGKYVLSLSSVYSAETMKLGNINMSDPADRARFDEALNARAPGVVKFANPNNPVDLEKLEQLNKTNIAKGLLPIKEADYHKTLIPVAVHEIWSGCYGRVAGRAYWSKNSKPPTVNLALSYVLLTREGDRIIGEQSPDAVFNSFAPSESLAPSQPSGMPDLASLFTS